MNRRVLLSNQLKSFWKNSPTIRDILKVSLGDMASKIFSIATMFLLIRGLSVEDYGAYTTFSGVSFLFSGVIGAGINTALIRFSSDNISRGKEKPSTLYIIALACQLIIYGILAGLCFLFPEQSTSFLFGRTALIWPLRFGLLAGLGMLVIQFIRSLYQAEEKFNYYIGTLWLIQIIILISLVVLWILKYLSFFSVAAIFVIVQIGLGAWLLVCYLRASCSFNLKFNDLHKKAEIKQFLIGSGWLIGYFIVLNLFSRMDVLMLLRFRGKEELAIYGVAFQYYSLSLLFLGSIHAVLLPKFSKVEMQKAHNQKVFLQQWIQWSAWLVIPIALFDVFGKPLFVWINGTVYEKSFPIFIIFSIGIWLSMIFSPLVNILISKGSFQFLFILGVSAFISNILLNLILVPFLGGIGAAITVIVSIGIINIASYVWVRLK